MKNTACLKISKVPVTKVENSVLLKIAIFKALWHLQAKLLWTVSPSFATDDLIPRYGAQLRTLVQNCSRGFFDLRIFQSQFVQVGTGIMHQRFIRSVARVVKGIVIGEEV